MEFASGHFSSSSSSSSCLVYDSDVLVIVATTIKFVTFDEADAASSKERKVHSTFDIFR